MTQEDKILSVLKEFPDGLTPTQIIFECGIAQYNARINGLRNRFGCICKHGNKVCLAEEHIRNKKTKNGTKFVYVYTPINIEKYWEKPEPPKEKTQLTII